MKHIHQYKTHLHQRLSKELANSGIEAAEIRRCRECDREMPFVMTRKGTWLPLFEESSSDEQDILLA